MHVYIPYIYIKYNYWQISIQINGIQILLPLNVTIYQSQHDGKKNNSSLKMEPLNFFYREREREKHCAQQDPIPLIFTIIIHYRF